MDFGAVVAVGAEAVAEVVVEVGAEAVAELEGTVHWCCMLCCSCSYECGLPLASSGEGQNLVSLAGSDG